MEPSILVVDDEAPICRMISMMLAEQGYRISVATDFQSASALLENNDFDLIFFDIMLGRNMNGLDLLRRIRNISLTTQVVIMTGYPDVETASEATRLGANDYICKPFDTKQICDLARHAIEKRRLMKEKEEYRANLEAIFRSMRDPILMTDRNLNLRHFNATAPVCGYTESNRGMPLDNINTRCSGRCRQALAETVRTGTPQELKRIECHRRKRPKKVVTITTSPIIGAEGQVEGAIAIIHDETALQTLENSSVHRSSFHGLVGDSEPMQKLYRQIEALADLSSTVLICGESGTGKELAAAALHESGNRKNRPFVALNCAAIPDSLLESELFGHVKGAFTGAVRDKQGKFQKAHGGTIFLDEIGDISPAMQLRLLRVLQEYEVEPVGGNRPVKVDVRVIAATNRNLTEKVQRGEFRNDLYYRLNVVQITTPPLRERIGEIPMLAGHFLQRFSQRFGREFTEISADLLSILEKHNWPGNVRELEHLLEHACIMGRSSIITSDHLPCEFLERSTPGETGQHSATWADDHETGALSTEAMAAIQKTGGNKTEAARLLGISRRTLYRWMDQKNNVTQKPNNV